MEDAHYFLDGIVSIFLSNAILFLFSKKKCSSEVFFIIHLLKCILLVNFLIKVSVTKM